MLCETRADSGPAIAAATEFLQTVFGPALNDNCGCFPMFTLTRLDEASWKFFTSPAEAAAYGIRASSNGLSAYFTTTLHDRALMKSGSRGTKESVSAAVGVWADI